MPGERIDLCGLWRFQPDPALEGEKAGYYHTQYNTNLWREVQLPCDFEACLPNLDTYEGTGWFQKVINVPDNWQDKRIILRFEGVNYHGKVWLNGQFVGENFDGFLPFEFPIQNLVRFDQDNVIMIRVDNFRRAGEVPGLQRGWRTYGGILREVEIFATNLLFIDSTTIIAEPLDNKGSLSIQSIIKYQGESPDEAELLVMDEIPLYWWNGNQEGEDNCIRKFEAAKRQLKTMIHRDINHPSVIFWSVSNENHENLPEVAKGNRELIKLAKELDPTRLSVHVSSYWKEYPNFDEDDVICVNDYPSLNQRGYGGKIDYDLSESTNYWRNNLQKLHELYPQKPILITEFGYASFEGIYGNGFGEDLQAQAIEKEFAGMDGDYICGATIWCWADHPWPQATFPFCYHLGISPYGLVTRERRKLKAYWAVRRMFRAKQGILEKPSPSSPGTGVTMIRPDLLNIPKIPFPEGFSIRPMRLDEGAIWRDIERDAEKLFGISDELFYNEFGADIKATQWRSYLIFNERGVAVGTISSWYNREYRGEDYGLIHWVAVRTSYQNMGLGRAALSYALIQMSQWHKKAYLNTSIERIPAIKLYLDFGFLPVLDSPYDIEKWRKVREKTNHPALLKIPKLMIN